MANGDDPRFGRFAPGVSPEDEQDPRFGRFAGEAAPAVEEPDPEVELAGFRVAPPPSRRRQQEPAPQPEPEEPPAPPSGGLAGLRERTRRGEPLVDTQFGRGLRTGRAAAFKGAGETLENFTGLTGRFGSLDAPAERLSELAEEELEAAQGRVTRIEDIDRSSPATLARDVADFSMYAIGQGLGSTAAPIAGGIAGGVAGGPVGAAAGAGLAGYSLILGEIRGELEEEGIDPDTIDRVAPIAAVPAAALEAVVPAMIGRGMTRQASGTVARRLARGIIEGGIGEAATEASQEAITIGTAAALSPEREFFTHDTLMREINAAIAGLLPGTVFGAGGALAQGSLAPQETEEGAVETPTPPEAVEEPVEPAATPLTDEQVEQLRQARQELHRRAQEADASGDVEGALQALRELVALEERGISALSELRLTPPEEAVDPVGDTSDTPVRMRGDDSTVELADGRQVHVEYTIVDAGEQTISHDPISFQPNPQYPEGVQDRRYHADRAAQEEVVAQAAALRPSLLLDPTNLATNGPPILRQDGLTLSGNQRTMLVRRAQELHPELYQQYLTDLVERSHLFGFDPDTAGERILSMVQRGQIPMLARVMSQAQPVERAELASLAAASNEVATKARDPLAEAAVQAERLRQAPEVLQSFTDAVGPEETIRQFLDRDAGKRFVQELVRGGVIPRAQAARYMDPATASPTAEGRQLVERLLLAAAIQDPDVVDRAPPNVLRKLEKAVPALVDVQQSPEWTLSGTLSGALDLLTAVASIEGARSVTDVTSQTDLTGRQFDPGVETMARFIEESNPTQVADALRQYAIFAREARAQAETVDMFGREPVDPFQTFTSIFGGPAPEAFFDIQEGLFEGTRELVGEEQTELLGGERAGLQESEARARNTVARLGPLIDRGGGTPEQIREYQQALGLLRRNEAIGEEEIRARSRISEPETEATPDQETLFDLEPEDVPPPGTEPRSYPPVEGGVVDGLTVGENIPNRSSIASSLERYEILEGIREVPVSDFAPADALSVFAGRVDEIRRSRALAQEIQESGVVDPLIVVVGGREGPYILEGHHRLSALHELGKEALPALVVRDLGPPQEGPRTIKQQLQEELDVLGEDVKRTLPGLERFELYASAHPEGTIELAEIRVDPERRNEGIGTKAMERLVAWADLTGRRIWLTAESDSGRKTETESLKRFYERFGFVRNAGRHKDFELSLYANMYRDPGQGQVLPDAPAEIPGIGAEGQLIDDLSAARVGMPAEIQDGINLLAEEARHRNAATTPGARVRIIWGSDKDIIGEVVTTRGQWSSGMTLVRVPAESIDPDARPGQTFERWYDMMALEPATEGSELATKSRRSPELDELKDEAAEIVGRIRHRDGERVPEVGDGTPLTPGPDVAKPAYFGDRQFLPIKPVEMVRLALEILGSNAATPSLFLKNYPRARGAFYADPSNPRIGLHRNLGKDYTQFARTLAHEMGHAIDFFPDETLARGNILARIASMVGYLKETIDAEPTDPSRALTKKDRAKLRREAIKKVGPRPAADSQGDLAAWRNEVSMEYRELLASEMDARNLIGRQRVHEELIALSEWWRPYERDRVTEGYIKYRESSRELIADALSVFLNSPGDLQERAPTFFDAFLAYADTKPEVWEAINAIQELIGQEGHAAYGVRQEELFQDFQRGEQQRRDAENRDDPQSFRSYLKQLLVSKQAPAVDPERARTRAAGELHHSGKNAVRIALQEMNHADNVNRIMLGDLDAQVHRPMIENGITQEHMGQLLFLRRVAEGDRGGMAEEAKEAIQDLVGIDDWRAARKAYIELGENHTDFDEDLLMVADSGVLNPRGYTPEEAARDLKLLEEELGPQKWAKLQDVESNFREILFQPVQTAAELGVYNLQTFEKKILPNRNSYVPFAVLDYFQGRVGATVKKQVGTLKGVANPFTAAILKSMALNRLNELQKGKVAVLSILETDFAGMASEVRSIDKYNRETHPGPGRGNLHFYINGKLKYVEVDEYISRIFELGDIGTLGRMAKTLGSRTYQLFHPLYVAWSLAWQARNLVRDSKRTYNTALQAAHGGKPTYRQAIEMFLDVGRLVKGYAQTAPAAWEHARRRHHPLIRQMMEDRSMGRAFHSFEPVETDSTLERLLQRYGFLNPESQDGRWKSRFKKIGRGVETLGVFQETWSKAAAYKILTDQGITGRERAYIVRNYTGTPDSTNKGAAADITNSVLLYANVIMAGYRADAEVLLQPQTAAGAWMRLVLVDIMPKTLAAGAILGALGDDLEEWFSHVPDYDLEKYIIIPIPPFYVRNERGETKAVYFRLPHADSSRVLAGALWSLLVSSPSAPAENRDLVTTMTRGVGRAMSLVAGEFPGMNPGLDLAGKWWAAAILGHNPYDSFRGRYIIPRTQWDAGGWPRMKEMLRYTLGEFGVVSQILGNWTYANPDESYRAPIEPLLRSVPGLSSLITVTNRGKTQERWWEIDQETRARARLRLDLSPQVRRFVSERNSLNRFGVERLSEAEQERREELNAWYRTSYLPYTQDMQEARDGGDDDAYEAARDALNESAPVFGQQ